MRSETSRLGTHRIDLDAIATRSGLSTLPVNAPARMAPAALADDRSLPHLLRGAPNGRRWKPDLIDLRGADGQPPASQRMRVSVVIPAKNEAANLPHVLLRLPDFLHEVILVDGHSDDDTVEVARSLRPDVRVIRQSRRGKGNALAQGFAAVTGDIVVMLDADGSADPAEIERFVTELTAGADFAKGSRFVGDGGSSDITPLRRVGNAVLSRLVNAMFGARYSDLCYGYNAFWVRCLPHLGLEEVLGSGQEPTWGDGFEIETMINLRISQSGLVVREVPSFEHPRIYGRSNLRTFRDGFRVLRTILTEHRRGRDRGGRRQRAEPRPGMIQG
jgi:glycosyltransferase involved in cell wall biosynthesis